MSNQDYRGYAGDLRAADAYSLLQKDASSKMVDVRTQAEWSYVGLPDLSSLDKSVIALEWQTYPTMAVNAHFVDRLSQALKAGGAKPDDPVLFICRSGARSRQAALAMTEAGWSRCYNVSDGFEGALDGSRHRGLVDGWKKGGLPWTQS
jgi:rhodanese-related sulfurtransferase